MAPQPIFSRKKALTIATVCMLSIAPAIGQEGEMEDLDLGELFNITLETGSFLELDLSKSPVTMTIIDDKMIKYSASRNLQEALEIYVPGFQYMVNKWNGSVWGMRGVASDRNNKIIVMVNGKKQNLQNFHGFASEYNLGILNDIQRIEVLRGPAGLVYGSGAIAGVVNIVTREVAEKMPYGSVKLDFNAANGLHGVVADGGLHHKFDENRSVAVHAGYKKSAGLGEQIAKSFGHDENGMTSVSKTGITTGDSPWATNGNSLVSVDYSAKNMNFYARATRQYTPVGSYFANDGGWFPDRRTHLRDNLMLSSDYTFDIGEDKLSIDGSAVFASNRVINREKAGAAEGLGWTTGENRFDGTLKYLMKRVEKLQVAAGVQYGFHRIGEDQRDADSLWNGAPFVAKIDYQNIAGFGEAFYSINDVVGVEAGVRYDNHTRTDGVWSPKGAVVLTPSKEHTMKFIVQSSSNNSDALTYEPTPTQREGTWTYEKGAEFGKGAAIYDTGKKDTANNAIATSNPDSAAVDPVTGEKKHLLGNTQAPVKFVNPEKSFSFELATSHNFGTFNVSPSLSYNRMTELHMWNSALKQTVNVGKYDAFVFELETSKKWEKLKLGGNGTLMMPLNFDTTSMKFSRAGFAPVYDENLKSWVPGAIKDSVVTSTAQLVKEQIAYDGKYFNSLHTVTAKLFADFDPAEFVTIHSDMRLFFGLWGRDPLEKKYAQDAAALGKETNFLGMHDKTPMAKWDMSVHFHLAKDLDVSVLAYDLLANDHNRHAVRWHQMSAPIQDGYYTVDQRSFGLKVAKGF